MKIPAPQPVLENVRGTRTSEAAPENPVIPSDDYSRILANASCNHAVFLSDERDRIVFWSAGSERLLGYSRAEAHGRTLQSLAGETMFSASTLGHSCAANTPLPAVNTWLRHKNGSRLWCWLSSDADKTKDGDTVFVNFLTDFTLQKQHEDQLRQANDIKEQLLANVSHELRTPLSAILLWSQLFEEQSVIDPNQLREGLEVIRRSAIEQRELIEDLIDMIRINQGKLRLDPAPTDLISETRSGLDAARMAAREKGLFLKESLDPRLGIVAGGSQSMEADHLEFTQQRREVYATRRPRGDFRHAGW
jgi:PAS domain S-box-containing protein